MAGVLGIDWHPQTLRSLWIMYQARLIDDWDHTSLMVSSWQMGKRRKTPSQIHPFRTNESNNGIKAHNIQRLGVFL